MTPDPRPAGALFRGLANEATSPRGAHRKDLPPHALGRAGPDAHGIVINMYHLVTHN